MSHHMIEIPHSKSVHSAGHDPGTNTLRVRFPNGATYEYEGVTPEQYGVLSRAESFGSHLRSEIIGKHKGRRVEE